LSGALVVYRLVFIPVSKIGKNSKINTYRETPLIFVNINQEIFYT